MAKAAAALVDLDGLARRIMLVPPGWSAERLATVLTDAEVDAVVVDDETDAPALRLDVVVRCVLPLRPAERQKDERRESRVDPADLGHKRSAEAGGSYAEDADRRHRPVAAAAMGDLLRHSPLRRPADFPACGCGPRFPNGFGRRRRHRRLPRPPRLRGHHAYLGDAVALAQGVDEPRSAPNRSRLCQAFRRNLRRRNSEKLTYDLPESAHRARLRLDGGRGHLQRRRRAGRFSRGIGSSGRATRA